MTILKIANEFLTNNRRGRNPSLQSLAKVKRLGSVGRGFVPAKWESYFAHVSKWLPFLCILAFICGCALHGEKVLWHQYYEPVEDNEMLSFVDDTLKEAVGVYGNPTRPINDIHIRTSFPRKKREYISRADVTDFKKLFSHLYLKRETPPVSILWSSFSPQTRLMIINAFESGGITVSDRFRLLEALNGFIETGFKNKAAGIKAGREFLDETFTGCILPLPGAKSLVGGFELCETITEAGGAFVLYISVPRNNPMFLHHLAHEVCHLLNPRLYDWYMEGICSLFADRVLQKQGNRGQSFATIFSQGEVKKPYAISYFMMREMEEVAGRNLRNIISFAVYDYGNDGKMHIDINAWLEQLPLGQKHKVIGIINNYSKRLGKYAHINSFTPPKKQRGSGVSKFHRPQPSNQKPPIPHMPSSR